MIILKEMKDNIDRNDNSIEQLEKLNIARWKTDKELQKLLDTIEGTMEKIILKLKELNIRVKRLEKQDKNKCTCD